MSDGTLDAEINHRIASAGIAWHQLKSCKVWSSKYVTLARKALIFRSVVLTILLYGCETWPALDSHIERLGVFQMNCLRFLCGFTWRDHKSNETVRHSCNLPSIAGEVRFRRLKWPGHVARMPDDRQPVQLLFGQLIGPGVRGRPRESWRSIVCRDLSALKVASCHRTAQDRLAWRQLVASVCT